MKKKIFEVWIPAALILLCVLLIARLTGANESPPQNTVVSDSVTISIMGQEHVFSPSASGQESASYTLTAEKPVPVGVSEYTGISLLINGIPFQSGETGSIQLEKLDKNSFITVEFYDLVGNSLGDARIPTLPADAAPWSVMNYMENGSCAYYIGCNQYIYKLNGNGAVVYYRNCGADIGNFKPGDTGGKQYRICAVEAGDPSAEQIARGETHRYAWMVLDENGQVCDWLEYMIPGARVPENQPVDRAEMLVLGERHYILASFIGNRVFDLPEPRSAYGGLVSGLVLQEIKDGELIFEWHSTDVPELYAALHPDTDYYASSALWLDYAPLESVSVDGNALVCSFAGSAVQARIDRASGRTVLSSLPAGEENAVSDVKLWEQDGISAFSDMDREREKVRTELFARLPIDSVYKEQF